MINHYEKITVPKRIKPILSIFVCVVPFYLILNTSPCLGESLSVSPPKGIPESSSGGSQIIDGGKIALPWRSFPAEHCCDFSVDNYGKRDLCFPGLFPFVGDVLAEQTDNESQGVSANKSGYPGVLHIAIFVCAFVSGVCIPYLMTMIRVFLYERALRRFREESMEQRKNLLFLYPEDHHEQVLKLYGEFIAFKKSEITKRYI